MTFYQELQLSSVGSKQLIKNTTDPKEKRRHILIYNFKVYLVMAFCVAVVSLYSKLTGSNNSVVGVTVLLAVLVLRQADFGIRTTHGLFCIAGIYGILMAGPRIANSVSAVPSCSCCVIISLHKIYKVDEQRKSSGKNIHHCEGFSIYFIKVADTVVDQDNSYK